MSIYTEKFALEVSYRETRPPFWDDLISRYRRPVTTGGYNIDSTCGLSQKSIDALDSYGLFLEDKNIPITIVLSIAILRNKQKQYHALSRQIWEIPGE